MKEAPVAGQTTRTNAEHQPTLRNVVHKRHPAGQFSRMVIGQQMRARREANTFGLEQCLGDENVWSGIRLPGRGEMLADPGFRKAQPVAEFNVL